MKLSYLVGNDNGNSEQKIVVNGKMYKFPNVYSVVANKINDEEITAEEMVPGLLDHLFVTVQSRSINGAHTVFVGKRAIQEGKNVHSMNIQLTRKHKEDLPIINTLANLAAIGVKESFQKKKKIVNEIEITVDMTTALPTSQWDLEKSEYFSNRFMGQQHLVTVHLGKTDILVKINFEYVKTVREGVISLFGIIENEKGEYRNDDLFKEFMEAYNIEEMDGSYFKDAKILHADIGDGTTEYSVTNGYKTEGQTHGRPHGLGHAIEIAIQNFVDDIGIDVSRQKFSQYLIGKNEKYHSEAHKHMRVAKQELAKRISEELMVTSLNLQHDYKCMVIYGGGSIELKDVMYGELKAFCDSVRVQLLWIDKKYATEMNAKGLEIFTNVMLPKFKEKALQV